MKLNGSLETSFGEFDIERELTEKEINYLAIDVALRVLYSRDDYEYEPTMEEHAENLASYLLEYKKVWARTYDAEVDIHTELFTEDQIQKAIKRMEESAYYARLRGYERAGEISQYIDDVSEELSEKAAENPEILKQIKEWLKTA